MWTYTVTAQDPRAKVDQLVRKELDLNWDGRVDIVTTSTPKPVSARRWTSTTTARWTPPLLREGQEVRKERDLDGDGRTDSWIYYENGKLVRKERDTNGDGKVDYWEYWENGQVDRIGEDLDGDGKVDQWTKGRSGNRRGEATTVLVPVRP